MAFLLLLTIALSTLVRVEVSVVNTSQLQTIARQNALLGLTVAIGNLQTTLGPDQRVSAQANILTGADAPSSAAYYWTGVWNADANHPDYELGERVAWLVSGSPDTDNGHQVNAGDSWVTLFGSHLGANNPERIRLPRVEIASGGPMAGSYAWWVSDEGVKVRYNNDADVVFGESDQNGDLRLSSPSHADIGSYALLGDYNANTMNTEAVLGFDTLPLVHGDSELKNPSSQARAQLEHELSFSSVGLLTDTRNGGLKQDLTVLFEGDGALPDLGTGLPDMDLFKSFYSLKDDINDSGVDANISPRRQTATEHGIAPVLTNFLFNFGFAPSQYADPATVLITMRPIIVLANPYNIKLTAADYTVQWKPGSHGDPPKVAVKILDPDPAFREAISLTLPLDTLFGTSLSFQLPNVAFEPGEVKIFTLNATAPFELPAAGVSMTNEGIPSSAYVWVDSGQVPKPGATRSKGGMAMRAGYNDFVLQINGSDAQRIEDVFSPGTYLDTGSGAVSMDDADGVPLESVLWGVPDRFNFKTTSDDRNSFGPTDNNTDGSFRDVRGSAWLVCGNIRAPRMQAPTDTDYRWDGNASYVGVYQGGGTSNNNVEHFLVDNTGTHAFWGWGRDGARGSEYVTLFDVPRRPLLSLGQLQHVNIGSGIDPAYVLGNSWASPFVDYASEDLTYRINEAMWDTFYFSGYEAAAHRWLNPRIRPLVKGLEDDDPRLADAKDISSLLGVEGMFNVNSTSVDAWRAQLAALRDRAVIYFNAASGSTAMYEYQSEDVNVPMPRTPLPSGVAFSPTDAEDATLGAMWNGFRDLTDAQIDALAGQVVYQIQKRGPFLALSDFVNRDISSTEGGTYSPRQMGALQAAIDTTDSHAIEGVTYLPTSINTVLGERITSSPAREQQVTGTDLDGLPNYGAVIDLSRNRAAPGYLTQADILTLMGSYINVRSDTFTIRAYGDVENVLSGEFASAVCEAVVQRIPTPLDPDPADPTEPLAAGGRGLGRKFVIISVRWLTKDEV